MLACNIISGWRSSSRVPHERKCQIWWLRGKKSALQQREPTPSRPLARSPSRKNFQSSQPLYRGHIDTNTYLQLSLSPSLSISLSRKPFLELLNISGPDWPTIPRLRHSLLHESGSRGGERWTYISTAKTLDNDWHAIPLQHEALQCGEHRNKKRPLHSTRLRNGQYNEPNVRYRLSAHFTIKILTKDLSLILTGV